MTQQLSMDDFCTSETIRIVHERRRRKGEKESAEELFARQCRQHQLPPFMAAPNQCYFALKHNGRQWRFDVAWPQFMLAVEIEGLVVRKIGKEIILGGRHATIGGFIEDCEKYNTAALLGWSVLRFAQKEVGPGRAIEMTIRVLHARGWRRETNEVTT